MRKALLVPLLLLSLCSGANAWGDTGHRIVCEIAMRLAAPATRAEIRRLLKADEEFDYFRDACTWPDHPRARRDEHFINLPRSASGIASNACPVADKCLLTAIRTDFDVLLSKSASDEQKLASLKFLGHWVGDIHQPLHVSFEDDRGGNNIRVSGECGGNLHSAWDSCLVEAAVGDDPIAAATELLKKITPRKLENWTQLDPPDWANESFAIAEDAKTKYCERNGASCDLPASGKVNISTAYAGENISVVSERLQKAGARLAHLLDTALGKKGESD